LCTWIGGDTSWISFEGKEDTDKRMIILLGLIHVEAEEEGGADEQVVEEGREGEEGGGREEMLRKGEEGGGREGMLREEGG
jgi:hypothetical protein